MSTGRRIVKYVQYLLNEREADVTGKAEFVDRLGLFFELLGATRTMGRVYGWLLICDPAQQSVTQLADALSVSKASISTVAWQLLEGGMVERLPSPKYPATRRQS